MPSCAPGVLVAAGVVVCSGIRVDDMGVLVGAPVGTGVVGASVDTDVVLSDGAEVSKGVVVGSDVGTSVGCSPVVLVGAGVVVCSGVGVGVTGVLVGAPVVTGVVGASVGTGVVVSIRVDSDVGASVGGAVGNDVEAPMTFTSAQFQNSSPKFPLPSGPQQVFAHEAHVDLAS